MHNNVEASPDERRPLLATPGPPTSANDSGSGAVSPCATWQRWRITALIIAIVFLQTSGEQLMDSPRMRIIEAIICYGHYESHDPSKIVRRRDVVSPGAVDGVDESWCKIDAVQAQLADLGAYQQVLDGLPGLLLALPFGWAADRFGRRPFMLSGFASCVVRWAWVQYVCWSWQQYSINWTLLSSLNGLFAGSTSVLYTLIFVVISDITPQEEQTNVFFQIGAASLFPILMMPPLSALLMRTSPWIPEFGGLSLLCIAFGFVLLIPETLHSQKVLPASCTQDSDRQPVSTMSTASPTATGTFSTACTSDQGLIVATPSQAPRHRHVSRYLYWAMVVTILPFTEHLLIAGTAQLQLQFLTLRFGLAISQATLFISFRAACSIVLLLVLLPRLSDAMTGPWGYSGRIKDLYLARFSLLMQAVGWIGTGLSTNIICVAVSMATSTMGSGTALFLRSLASTFVPADRTGTMFGFISTIDILGSMAGAPILAASFEWGMRIGGFWLGSPFYIIGILSTVFVGLLWTINSKRLPEYGSLAVQGS